MKFWTCLIHDPNSILNHLVYIVLFSDLVIFKSFNNQHVQRQFFCESSWRILTWSCWMITIHQLHTSGRLFFWVSPPRHTTTVIFARTWILVWSRNVPSTQWSCGRLKIDTSVAVNTSDKTGWNITERRSLHVFFRICGCSLNFWSCIQSAAHAETQLPSQYQF